MHFIDFFGVFGKDLCAPEAVVEVAAQGFERRGHGAVNDDTALGGNEIAERMISDGFGHGGDPLQIIRMSDTIAESVNDVLRKSVRPRKLSPTRRQTR